MWQRSRWKLQRCRVYRLPFFHGQFHLNSVTLQGYNVGTGAKYFSDSLAENGGNFLLTLGRYNGWEQGMDIVSTLLLLVASRTIFTIPSPRVTLLACATPNAMRRTTLTSGCPILDILFEISNDHAHAHSLFQTCNGWLLNKDAYQLNLGKYHNLDGC